MNVVTISTKASGIKIVKDGSGWSKKIMRYSL